jgi:hypothetical protein
LLQSDTQDLSITISAVLEITTSSLPNTKESEAYSTTLQSTGGIQPVNWSVDPPLPDGLSLNASTGEIAGIPGAGTAGTHTLTFTVQDSSPTPQTANKQLDLSIDPP